MKELIDIGCTICKMEKSEPIDLSDEYLFLFKHSDEHYLKYHFFKEAFDNDREAMIKALKERHDIWIKSIHTHEEEIQGT